MNLREPSVQEKPGEASTCPLLCPARKRPPWLVQGGLFADNLPCKQGSGGDTGSSCSVSRKARVWFVK